jgi:hypothetical protein
MFSNFSGLWKMYIIEKYSICFGFIFLEKIKLKPEFLN